MPLVIVPQLFPFMAVRDDFSVLVAAVWSGSEAFPLRCWVMKRSEMEMTEFTRTARTLCTDYFLKFKLFKFRISLRYLPYSVPSTVRYLQYHILLSCNSSLCRKRHTLEVESSPNKLDSWRRSFLKDVRKSTDC